MKVVNIDDIWSIEMGSCVVLIEEVKTTNPKAKNPISRLIRGYYGHVDEALRAYLRKSIRPNSEIAEIVTLIEDRIESISKTKEVI